MMRSAAVAMLLITIFVIVGMLVNDLRAKNTSRSPTLLLQLQSWTRPRGAPGGARASAAESAASMDSPRPLTRTPAASAAATPPPAPPFAGMGGEVKFPARAEGPSTPSPAPMPAPDAGTGVPPATGSSQQHARLQIFVLTMGRPRSLSRLVQSLQAAEYDNDAVDITLCIDKSRDNSTDPETAWLARSFDWPHGHKNIVAHPTQRGLRDQWLNCWIPDETNDDEKVVILEDDLEVSKYFWRWVKAAHAYFHDSTNITGFTLHRANHCPDVRLCTTSDLAGGPVPDGHNFAMPLIGSWGFSPRVRHWKRFRKWVQNFDSKPHVKGHLFSNWYETFEKQGKCPGPSCMWTIFHIKYCDIFADRWTVWFKGPNGTTLAANHREKGLHYTGNKGRDHEKLAEWDSRFVDFGTNLHYVGLDGKLIASPTAASPAESSTPMHNHDARLGETLHADCYRAYIDPPWMTSAEVRMIKEHLHKAKPQIYLEWGTGQSTSHYPLFATKTYAIDNYEPWCAKVLSQPTPSCLQRKGALDLRCVHAPFPVKGMGNVDPENIDKMAELYVTDNAGVLNDIAQPIDAALIDGRFRVACSLRILPFLRPTSIVFVHDFWDRQQHYRDILNHYRVVDRVDRLAVLQPLDTSEKTAKLYENYLDSQV